MSSACGDDREGVVIPFLLGSGDVLLMLYDINSPLPFWKHVLWDISTWVHSIGPKPSTTPSFVNRVFCRISRLTVYKD